MASRYFFALCALALIAAVVAGPVAETETEVDLEEVDIDEDSERIIEEIAILGATEAAMWLYKRFVHVKIKCFPGVVKNCDMSPFKHPQQYYRCADNYFQSHAERCLRK